MWSSSMAAELIAPSGLATPRPAMSGALPWMGSKMPTPVCGFTFPLAASPSVPCKPAPRSLRMSPNRLDATSTSNRSGARTIW